MSTKQAERAAILTAGSVIVLLTIGAFWLSYAHLAEVALEHGLADSPERAWAWPATIDLFILAGEVLMFRAALRGGWDAWAIGLTAAGSLGSISLNVAGVADRTPSLAHVVAAVPPTAALLAFGALMRQVHSLVTDHDTTAPEPAPAPASVLERPTPEHAPAPGPTPDPLPEAEQATDPAPQLPTAQPHTDDIPTAAPAPEPAQPAAVPAALVQHAQKLADTHKATNGAPIDAATLRARLGVPDAMADAITAQLA